MECSVNWGRAEVVVVAVDVVVMAMDREAVVATATVFATFFTVAVMRLCRGNRVVAGKNFMIFESR